MTNDGVLIFKFNSWGRLTIYCLEVGEEAEIVTRTEMNLKRKVYQYTRLNKLDFKRRTANLRHGIVKLVAPKLYGDYLSVAVINVEVSATPRPMTLFLKKYFKNGEPLTAVEIGVDRADNAVSILEELLIKKLILIDPYMAYVDSGRLNTTTVDGLNAAMVRLSKYGQAQFIRKTSEEAVKDIHEPLDFVYIDGNHSYEYVKNDIALYYPLVKRGGVIGGHDYTPYYGCVGVCQAVNELGEKHGGPGFYIVFPDWWLIKP